MFNASFASAVIIMTIIIVRGFQALALLLRYPHPKSLPSGEGTCHRPAGLYAALPGSMRGVSHVLSCAKLFEQKNIFTTGGQFAVFDAVNQFHYLVIARRRHIDLPSL